MKYGLAAALVLMMAPAIASAGGRCGWGGGGWGGGGWGWGGGGWAGGGWGGGSGWGFSIGYANPGSFASFGYSNFGGNCWQPAPVWSPPVVYQPVVWSPPPVVCQPAVWAPPPVVWRPAGCRPVWGAPRSSVSVGFTYAR